MQRRNKKPKSKSRTKINDGYYSLAKKVGTTEDSTYNQSLQHSNLTANTAYISELYDTTALIKNIISIPINDAFKDGREFDGDISIPQYEDGISDKINEALKMASLYGGCFIYMHDGREPSEPIIKGKVNRISVLLKTDITSLTSIELNPIAENYLQPTNIQLGVEGSMVDNSRLIYVDGEECSRDRRILNSGYGLSVIERLHTEVFTVNNGSNRILNIMDRLSQDVLKIDGLNNSLSDTDSEQKIYSRLTAMNQIKNIMSTLAIDSNDDYANVNRSLSGTSDAMTEFKELVCSASRIPYSKLFGTSSTGLNSTGENELKNYYDEVKSKYQVGRLAKIYNVLDEAITGKKIEYEFVNLMPLTGKEEAETLKLNTDAYTALFNIGVLEDSEIKELLGYNTNS